VFVVGNNTLSQMFDYTTNLAVDDTDNVENFDVYINNDYYGSDVNEIQINTGDVLRIEVVKTISSNESKIKILNPLLA
jgi:hypothetical protein